MRNSYPKKKLAEVFVNQSQKSAYDSQKNFFMIGNSLYYLNNKMQVAYIDGDVCYLLDTKGFDCAQKMRWDIKKQCVDKNKKIIYTDFCANDFSLNTTDSSLIFYKALSNIHYRFMYDTDRVPYGDYAIDVNDILICASIIDIKSWQIDNVIGMLSSEKNIIESEIRIAKFVKQLIETNRLFETINMINEEKVVNKYNTCSDITFRDDYKLSFVWDAIATNPYSYYKKLFIKNKEEKEILNKELIDSIWSRYFENVNKFRNYAPFAVSDYDIQQYCHDITLRVTDKNYIGLYDPHSYYIINTNKVFIEQMYSIAQNIETQNGQFTPMFFESFPNDQYSRMPIVYTVKSYDIITKTFTLTSVYSTQESTLSLKEIKNVLNK